MVASPFTIGVIVNPDAQRGRGSAHGDAVVAALTSVGFVCERIEAANPAVCRGLVEAAIDRWDGCVLIGGDGLIFSLVQLPSFRAKPFAVFPAGTGNDFSATFGFSADPQTFAQQLHHCQAQPTSVDAGSVHLGALPDAERLWFTCNVSFGLVARVNRRANNFRFRLGPIGYKLALVRELLVGRYDRYHLIRRGADHHSTELLMTVMNIPLIGGGIVLIPGADPRDGSLDLITVQQATRRRVFSVLPLLASAKHERLPEVTITHETEFTIDGDQLEVYADGDSLGTAPAHIRVEPHALRVWAPLSD